MKHHQVISLVFLLLASLPEDVHPSYPPSSKSSQDFLPSKPGEAPSCVKNPRLTFCLEPEKYPKERIVYLLENKMFDVDTLLQDETRDTYTFEARDGPTYPATMMYDSPSPRPTSGYSKPRAVYPPMTRNGYRNPKTINFNHQLRNLTFPHSPSSRPKYDSTNHFKLPTYNSYPSRSNTTSFNSFTSTYPSKYDTSRHANFFNGASPSRFNDGQYHRYNKNGYRGPTVSYHPPRQSNNWWKKGNRRKKRQADLDDLCPARSNYIMPRAAQSVGGNWMFLVNVDDQYTQLVKSETCIRNTCEGSCDAPEGFLAVCQQQYVQKRLVALDGSGSKLNSDTFWFPSCCICKIRPGAG